MVDDDGDIGVSIFPYLFYFVTEDSKPFLGISAFHRTLDVRNALEAAKFVVQHNSEYYAPKLYTVVSDNGKIRFRISHSFNWEIGASDKQIQSEIETFITAAMDTMHRLDQVFPDSWSLSSIEQGN